MSDTTHPAGAGGQGGHEGEGATRRDFLYLATGAVAAVGVASVAWPFIDSMNPAADTLALAQIDVDLSPIQVGQSITVTWRGKPVFIRRRTEEEIAAAASVNLAELRDPATGQRARQAAAMAGHGRHLHPSGLRSARPEIDRSQG